MASLDTKTHVRMDEAVKLIYASVPTLTVSSEQIETPESFGRILTEDVEAQRNIPHFVASAVDGYALRSDQTRNAGPAYPATFRADQIQWTNTGGALPEWADCVAMIEDTSLDESGQMKLFKTLTPGANVRPVGEDVMKGQIIGRKGDRIEAAQAALLLAAGLYQIPVQRRPRTLFIPTGNEILAPSDVPADQQVPGEKILETNSTLLKGFFHQWGFPIDIHPIIPDDPERLSQAVEKGNATYDLVLIGAGSAKGRRDFTAQILEQLGDLLFRWVLVRPGRPAMGALVKGKPVICLPGFPTSTAVSAWGLVFPLLKWMASGEVCPENYIKESTGSVAELSARFLIPHSSPPGVSEWLRVQTAEIDGEKFIWSLSLGSSSMSAMSECDGLVLLSESTLECPKGTVAQLLMNRRVDYEKRILFQGSNDPAFERITSFVRSRNADLVMRSVGSLGGISALSRGEGHLAACHLLDGTRGTYNDSFIERLQGNDCWERILLFWREQGIIVQPGNPRGLHNVFDLTGEGVSIVNRQPGAGTRVLLDHLLSREGVSPSSVWGYNTIALTHLDAASRIASGQADAALGIRAAAKAMGLDFIPLVEEPYEIVIPGRFRDHPGILALKDALKDPAWKKQVNSLGGYRWPN